MRLLTGEGGRARQGSLLPGDFQVPRFETTAFWTRIVSPDFGVGSHGAFQIHILGGEERSTVAALRFANLIGLLHTSESGISFCSCCSCISDRSDVE